MGDLNKRRKKSFWEWTHRKWEQMLYVEVPGAEILNIQ